MAPGYLAAARAALPRACPRRRNPRATRITPKTIAYIPMIQATVTSPMTGKAKITMPKATERIPFRIRSHSPSISLRSRMAAVMRKTPETIDHALIRKSRANAAAAGSRNAMMPATMSSRPSSANGHHRSWRSAARMPAMIANTPSTIAYAPNSSTSDATNTPGWRNAISPITIASTPRKANAHQFRASTMFIGDLPGRGFDAGGMIGGFRNGRKPRHSERAASVPTATERVDARVTARDLVHLDPAPERGRDAVVQRPAPAAYRVLGPRDRK